MIYILKTVGGLEVARSTKPILVDGDLFRSDDETWLDPRPSSGATVTVEASPPPVPFRVTRRQARQALFLSGVSLSSVDALIDALPEPSRTVSRIFWEDSNDFERTNSTLNAMASALNLTQPQLDDLFRLAQTL